MAALNVDRRPETVMVAMKPESLDSRTGTYFTDGGGIDSRVNQITTLHERARKNILNWTSDDNPKRFAKYVAVQKWQQTVKLRLLYHVRKLDIG